MKHSKYESPWFQYPTFSWRNRQAVIIGAGIAGCQMAWHLCEAGWQVTLVERHDQIAEEASGNPVGVISPKMTAQPSIGEDFYTQAFDYTLSLLETLLARGHNIDWQKCGVLQLAYNSRELKRWHALSKRGFANDFIQLLNEEQTQKMAGFDLGSPLPFKSSYFPNGGWIKPASFSKVLCQHPNCNIIYHAEAIELTRDNGHWQIIDKQRKVIAQSEVAIISSGKDLRTFSQTKFLPAMPVSGQTTLATASPLSQKLNVVIGHEGYLSPAIALSNSSKQHLFGATFVRDDERPTLTKAADLLNLKSLQQTLPELAHSFDELSSAHTAVRMTTPDRFPYVGALPDMSFYQQHYHDLQLGKHWKEYPKANYQKGLFILGGLGSRGIITSGLCAKALTQLLDNQQNSKQHEQLYYCHPARYLIKDFKRGLFSPKNA